jgi:glycosyltransferase involved in cell wall biosynthesis
MNKVDVIYCWWAFSLSFVGILLAKVYRKKIIINAIGFEISKEIFSLDSISWKWGALHNPLQRFLVVVSLKNATRIITISKQNAKLIKNLVGIIPEVIYEGVETQKFFSNVQSHTRKKKVNKNVVLLTVATLSSSNIKRKGLDILMKAVAMLLFEGYNLELVVVGEKLDGYQELRKLIYSLKINEKVKFIGKISEKELLRLYSECDIYVQPSRQEGFPTTLIEALSSGKPIISTKIPSIEEVIEDGKDGILVPPNCPSSLANALKKLIIDVRLREFLVEHSRYKSLLFSKDMRKDRLRIFFDDFLDINCKNNCK